MGAFHNGNHLLVHLGGGIGGASERRIAAQILVADGFQSNHVEFVSHAVTRHHSARQLGGLLNIVGCSCRNGVEITSSAARPPVSVAILFRTSSLLIRCFSPSSTCIVYPSAPEVRNNSDFGDRCGAALSGGDKGMTNLMISDDFFSSGEITAFCAGRRQLRFLSPPDPPA